MARLWRRFRSHLGEIPSGERKLVGAAMALSTAIVLLYVFATRPNELGGDQIDYHNYGVFFTEGKWWWSPQPFGEPHVSAWKAPVYPLWVGVWYTILGVTAAGVAIVQSLLAALTVGLTWALARRLFDARVAIVSAFIVAVFPLVWEWFGLLYTEALAIPMALLLLLLMLERAPTSRLALGVGAAMGVAILLRPTFLFMFAGFAVAWWVAAGLRRGAMLTGIAVAVTAVVVGSWTVRNYIVLDGFVPISMQEAAPYGTFSSTAANDPVWPYSWRPTTPETEDIFDGPPIPEPELRTRLNDVAYEYIADHPFSLAEAFFWNGLSRFWDVRRPARAAAEPDFQGQAKAATIVGLAMYYVLLPLAVYGLWRQRHRRSLVLPVLALAAAASVVFTTASATRYRAPLEPLIVVLAASALAPRGAPTPTRSSPAA